MMEWEKQLHQLSDRLCYLKDIFPGKHEEDIALLETRLGETRRKLESCTAEEAQAEMTSLEDLFFFMECKLEDKLTPMDKVRIVRHPHRICLRDILENVSTTTPKSAGRASTPSSGHGHRPRLHHAQASRQGVSSARARDGHEKGHGEEFRNGGSAKPWGNAKAKHYMGVAETEGIPIHALRVHAGRAIRWKTIPARSADRPQHLRNGRPYRAAHRGVFRRRFRRRRSHFPRRQAPHVLARLLFRDLARRRGRH